MTDPVNSPVHYTSSPAICDNCGTHIECIQVTRHMGFNLGNATKYIWRAGLKGDAIEDLRKAAWYLNDEIARLNPCSCGLNRPWCRCRPAIKGSQETGTPLIDGEVDWPDLGPDPESPAVKWSEVAGQFYADECPELTDTLAAQQQAGGA